MLRLPRSGPAYGPIPAHARAYARHTDSGSETGATATYVRASLAEVVAALGALTSEPHLFAMEDRW